ncbi:MAG: type II toxin-antitoxin system VapC family toxin [Gemmatimonadaceae bacterium]|nr:type II toxin-antitoxin system VapC family toxin [Acetobacteraceae bacterium]
MLDTNIASDLIRNPGGRAAGHLANRGVAGICISIMTAAELRYGAERRNSRRLSLEVDGFLARIEVMPFDQPADAAYGRLRAALTAAGTPIGPIGCLIAAHALALQARLVTDNVREFSRAPGLMIENWLA